MSKINGQIQKFRPQNDQCVKFDNSIDSGATFPLSCDMDAASELGAVVWGPFFEAVGLVETTAHEDDMRKFPI